MLFHLRQDCLHLLSQVLVPHLSLQHHPKMSIIHHHLLRDDCRPQALTDLAVVTLCGCLTGLIRVLEHSAQLPCDY